MSFRWQMISIAVACALAFIFIYTQPSESSLNQHAPDAVMSAAQAGALGVDDSRLSFHVLEAVSPSAALLEYIGANRVDHVVMGARASSAVRRILGSVSSQVVAEAACTVTVVRTPQYKGDEATGNANAPG